MSADRQALLAELVPPPLEFSTTVAAAASGSYESIKRWYSADTIKQIKSWIGEMSTYDNEDITGAVVHFCHMLGVAWFDKYSESGERVDTEAARLTIDDLIQLDFMEYIEDQIERDGRSTACMFGMSWRKDEFVDAIKSSASRTEEEACAIRNACRLRVLEKHLRVLTFDESTPEKECNPFKHLQSDWNTPEGQMAIVKRLTESNVTCICVDYVSTKFNPRDLVTESFVSKLLPMLITHGIIRDRTTIFLMNDGAGKIKALVKLHAPTLRIEPVAEMQNHLFSAAAGKHEQRNSFLPLTNDRTSPHGALIGLAALPFLKCKLVCIIAQCDTM